MGSRDYATQATPAFMVTLFWH